jgi:carbonic anhydrase
LKLALSQSNKSGYGVLTMKNMTLVLTLSTLLAGSSCFASEAPHWGYQGDGAPKHWSELEGDYALCGSGENQSPINIINTVNTKLPKLNINYSGYGSNVINNGHSIQVNYQPGSTLVIDGDSFELKQFHFHSPSENKINGKSFPLEGHFVHADKNGNLAVIAVMFEEGQANAVLDKFWKQIPKNKGGTSQLTTKVAAQNLLPENTDYYRFNGSLTTPPCSEGVRWFVMKQPVTVSEQQVEKFSHIMHHPNNRNIQKLNARLVLE